MCAVYKGYLWAVEMLLSHGASTTVKCPRGSTVLHYAVGLPDKEQRIEIVQLLLQYGADITCKNENGTTPLSLAAECQRLDYLRLMVPSLSTLSTLDEHRDKFLCLAARKGDVYWISELIRLGADVNKIQSIERHIRAHRSGIDVLAEKAKLAQRKSTDQDPEDKIWESLTYHCLPTALHHAAFENCIGTMEILVSQGAIVDSFPESSLLTPLHVALARGHMAAARWLLDKGADLNLTSNQQHWWSYMDSLKSAKWTSLHFAAIGGRETFEFVKSQGIAISWEDKTIASLWESAAGGRDRANEDFMLLVYGSCCNSETGEYLDCMYPDESLHININRALDMDKIFHTMHVFPYLNIAGKDKMGQTLLHHAASSGNVPAIEYLLRRGHPIDATDYHSQTALLYAAKSCKADAVRVLLEHGAHLSFREGDNALKIIKACLIDYEPKVSKSVISMRATLQELMNRGGHLNLMYMGSGFLRDVATVKYRQHQEEALITMLDWGADLDAIDEHGMTPLHYAVQFKDSRIIALLLQYDTSLAVKNREGKTPVQLAEDALVFGLKASLYMKHKEGKSPLQLAQDSAQQKIVDLLMRKAAGLKIEFVPRDTPPNVSSWRGLL